MGSSSSPSDSLNGLKFGQKIYFEDGGFGAPAKSGGGSSSSSSAGGGGGGGAGKPSPPKKGRSGVVQARCQVEGCKVDLSDAKAYYSRHKVCGMHSKSPVVTVAGLEQRFCQQCSRDQKKRLSLAACKVQIQQIQSRQSCELVQDPLATLNGKLGHLNLFWRTNSRGIEHESHDRLPVICYNLRFHQLPEFDQVKRSCRRRLAGHNERRRKPPPGSLISSQYGRLPSSVFETSKGGGFVMDFSTFPRFTGRDSWPTTRASSDQVSSSQSTHTGKFFPNPWPNQPENAPSSNLFLQGSTSGTHYSSPTIPSGECFAAASDSGCALSLLSNQPWGPRARPTGLGVNHFPLNAASDAPIVQSPSTHGSAVNPFSSTTWGFKGNDIGSGSQHMAPDLGLSHISQPGNNPYSGEFESPQQSGRQYAMELEHSRGAYGSSTQHMHWSL
ncbi:hypothetical protein RHSIM_Rhsim03G0008900 [Rhododendron simsii]|uniref:SBP-type domain-containing protein n=1 Tax=Rhododendron simsii TaxID=118357 RepID=A0A834LRZ4_RHOSS|nr:hypothetical protein RHSIM_Rhsim03G0008900 [Rhododendron simsii]